MRPAAATVLTTQNKYDLVFHIAGLQWIRSFLCSGIVRNSNVYLCLLKQFQLDMAIYRCNARKENCQEGMIIVCWFCWLIKNLLISTTWQVRLQSQRVVVIYRDSHLENFPKYNLVNGFLWTLTALVVFTTKFPCNLYLIGSYKVVFIIRQIGLKATLDAHLHYMCLSVILVKYVISAF